MTGRTARFLLSIAVFAVAAALFAAICVTGAAGADGRVWLDELPLRDTMCGWGTPRANKSVDGNALRIGTQQFARGVGTHAESLSMWKVMISAPASAKSSIYLIGSLIIR